MAYRNGRLPGEKGKPIKRYVPSGIKGRDPLVITDEMRKVVRRCAQAGLTMEKIALIVGFGTTDPIAKYFEKELAIGRANAHSSIGATLFDLGMGVPKLNKRGQRIGWKEPPNVAAAIFYAKTQMGWRENADPDSGKSLESLILAALADRAAKVIEARPAVIEDKRGDSDNA